MGLLSKVSESGLNSSVEEKPAKDNPQVQKKSNSVGLLKKSLMAGQYDKLDFFEFIQKYNFSLCSFLQLNNGYYCIQKSFGFDGKSICQSYSTKDFWDGTIKEKNNLYTFETNTSDILPFYQFFSDKLKDKIQLLHIYKFDDDSIFIFITDTTFAIPQTLIYDLQNTSFDSDINVNKAQNESEACHFNYEIDLSEALESFVLTNSKTNSLILNAISEQLYLNLCTYFPSPSYVTKIGNGRFNLSYAIPQALPVELLTNHLQHQIKYVLDNHSELISIELLNNC